MVTTAELQQHQQMYPSIEAEDFSGDTDSAYSDSDLESYTTSLKSSILDYQYENGRRYHAFREGEYYLPNDDAEKDRLDLHHHTLTLLQNGKLFSAPIPERPQQILDLGTGTGIWAIEMGDSYPSAIVVGNDLSPIQPNWVPPNVKFEVDDIESEWTHPKGSFDFIYDRYLVGSISDWQKYINQMFRAVKPGGYVELLEPYCELLTDDNSIRPKSILKKWNETFCQLCEKVGKPVMFAPTLKDKMEKAGFTDVTEIVYKLPNAPWAKDSRMKELGAYHMTSFLEGLEGLTLRLFTNVGGMTLDECNAMMKDVRKEIKDKSMHTYYKVHCVYGRKPEIV